MSVEASWHETLPPPQGACQQPAHTANNSDDGDPLAHSIPPPGYVTTLLHHSQESIQQVHVLVKPGR